MRHGREWLAAWLAVLLLAISAHARATEAALQADFEALRQREQLAGLVWGWFDGQRSALGAAGFADAPRGTPMTPQARVQVGSVAKTVTALAALRLVSLDRLDLEMPLATLLPNVQIHNPWAATHPLRLRHLLDMSSGLRDLRLHHAFSRRHGADAPLADALHDDEQLLTLRTPPGEQFSYSNAGFLLVGMVIEATVNERFEGWIDRELLRPLGLHDSTVRFVGVASSDTGQGTLAQGHLDDLRVVQAAPFGMRTAGQLTTTAADLLTLLRFVAGDGRIDKAVFIHTPLLRAMGRPNGTAAARAGVRAGYGLGLFTRDRQGAVGLCHGGSVAGWRAMACVFPQDDRGFAIVHNTDREDADYNAFDARLVQHLGLRQPAPPVSPQRPRAEDAAWSGLYIADPPRLDLMDLPGRLFGAWRLHIDADGATLREGFGTVRVLYAEGAGLYRQADRQQPTLALLRGADGRPRLASGMVGLRRISVAEWAAPWSLVTAGAAGFGMVALWLPWRCRRAGRSLCQPTTLVAWGLIGASALSAAMPWQQLAEASAANIALAAVSLLLPVAAAWQLVLAAQERRVGHSWRLETVAALSLCGLCATLAAFGLWPLVPWRW